MGVAECEHDIGQEQVHLTVLLLSSRWRLLAGPCRGRKGEPGASTRFPPGRSRERDTVGRASLAAFYCNGSVRRRARAGPDVRGTFSLSDAKKGEIDRSGKFVARGSGELTLRAEVGSRSAKTAIRIEEAEKPRRVTFARDIEGILTKRGCNDTTCHGGVKGRGGFRLSVYGIYPREDYKAIVEGGTFRVLTTDENPKHPRIDLKQPEKSLLLLEADFQCATRGRGAVSGGLRRLRDDSELGSFGSALRRGGWEARGNSRTGGSVTQGSGPAEWSDGSN